uniref:alcohol dehydrogenase catalytic domain-containing protein n=1 Tax=Lentzea alba TaxID=2714351 RepID=UPI0039BFBEAF
MRAVRTAELQVVHVPEAVAGPGEVLVRTVATSINPVDDKTAQSVFGEVGELGWDLAGVVVEGAGEFKAGDRVVAMSHQLSTGRGPGPSWWRCRWSWSRRRRRRAVSWRRRRCRWPG